MPAPDEITVAQLNRLIGTPEAPLVIDVRIAEDKAADQRFIPGAVWRDWRNVAEWGPALAGRRVVVSCLRGKKLSQGAAAWLRHFGASAESLEGGHEGWVAAKAPLVTPAQLPQRDAAGRTLWVTRHRPKVDRIACPWLIRRFIDPDAVFLFVAPGEVADVADRYRATPFDIEGTFWSHRGSLCTFDVMLAEFGLHTEALARLATIVRGADTDQLALAPESAGLLAASLGLSRMYRDDLEQLTAGMGLYDAFYRWCRDATGESHNWPAARG
jgi:rhodanese-related sulfurtransferase